MENTTKPGREPSARQAPRNDFPPCPMCRAPSPRLFAQVRGRRAATDRLFDFLECRECGSVSLSPLTPAPADLYHAAYFAPPAKAPPWRRRVERRWVSLLHGLRLRRARGLSPGARVLDVGCGSGAWIEFLAVRGFDAHGLDPSEEACAAARRRGLNNVHLGSLDENRLPGAGFDVITAIHCLEHAPDPCAFVAGAVRLLKPGGWLGITIPNIASWEARRARGEWYHLDPPYHAFLPSPLAMRNTFVACGLQGFRALCPSLEYCQSVLYAAGWDRHLPFPLTAAALPLAAAVNLALALGRRAGTIEYWGRLGRDDQRPGPP